MRPGPRTAVGSAADNKQRRTVGPVAKVSPRAARAGEVLELIRQGKAETTSELAAAMGIARSTVTERLEALQRLDLIVTAGATAPSRGRPAGRLAFNTRAGVTLAAQVGMTGTLLAITDLGAEVQWSTQVHLDVGKGPDALFDLLHDHFHAGLRELGRSVDDVHGVGIGLPGDIEVLSSGGPTTADGRAWSEDELQSRLSDTFGALTVVDRDVNLMALAEHRLSWPDSQIFLCLKVGTVIATGLVIGDDVVRGATGLLGEIGHTKVQGADQPCACGSRGCLNAIAGGTAIADALRAQGLDAHEARDVAALANAGNIPAGQAVRAAGERAGEILAGAINLLNPDVITVWGYLVDAGDQFMAGLQESIFKAALPASVRATVITRAQLGDDAGLRGAAMTVVERALTPDRVDLMVDAIVA